MTTQLSRTLDRSGEAYNHAMDGMTTSTDPDLAISTARLRLHEARHPALSTYRRLNSARTEVAHVSATPIDYLGEVQPRSLPRRFEDRQPPPSQRPGHRGPAR